MVLWILGIGLIGMIGYGIQLGFSLQNLTRMIIDGMKKPYQVYLITLLVGGTSAVWMASGTLPLLITQMVYWVHPKLFLLSAFCITCFASLFIGSALGTTGIVGILFVIAAKANHIPIGLVAGAVISAAYFGERTTPLSSCANLVGQQSETSVYLYISRLFKGTLIPFIATLILYIGLSFAYPASGDMHQIAILIKDTFHLSPLLYIPFITIIFLSILRIPVVTTLITSCFFAAILGVVYQSATPMDMLHFAIFGYKLDASNALSAILKSGGMVAMKSAVIVVLLAGIYAEMIKAFKITQKIESIMTLLVSKFGRYSTTLFLSIIGNGVGCSQTFAIMTTAQVMTPYYKTSVSSNGTTPSNLELAEDLGNSAVIVAPLIPWNVGAAVPAAILSTSTAYIPFAFYLYLIPLYMVIKKRSLTKKERRLEQENSKRTYQLNKIE